MKRLGLVALTGVALVLAAGCSATPPQKQTPTYELDYERMAMIQQVADKRGVRIIWINAPRKSTFF